jgi:uncharacterized protein YxeA
MIVIITVILSISFGFAILQNTLLGEKLPLQKIQEKNYHFRKYKKSKSHYSYSIYIIIAN